MPLTPGVLDELRRLLGPDGLVVSPEGRLVYECDMHTFYKGAPDAVALPERTAEVVAIVKLCHRARVPVVPRGSGTGLIGGATAPLGGVMVGLNRMNRILEIDLPNRCATVQPGLINLWLTRAVEARGWFFAPDPSSQMVSSIGGNVSTNAGGPHCLKYGITANHVLGLELVKGAGEVVRLGGKVADRAGYDLTGVAVGSEGTFGLVTAVTVRLLHTAEAVQTILASFGSIEEASEAVSAIIAAGIIPAALEMLDELMIRAINEGTGAGYPKDAGAVLLIELDGPRAEVLARRSAWRRSAASAALSTSESRATRASARSCGKDARRRRARWGASRRRTCFRIAWCRAPGSPRSCARSARSPSATACRSPTSFTRATATSTRSSSTTTGTPRSSSARRRRTRRCSTPVSRWAARSRASTAWVSTRPRISRSSTARPI